MSGEKETELMLVGKQKLRGRFLSVMRSVDAAEYKRIAEKFGVREAFVREVVSKGVDSAPVG